jgi:Domain of Unknown Function with PDB structure (DUF3857)/Transglutaminase-like superfamily
MFKKIILSLFVAFTLQAQKFNPSWLLIPQELKENANACIIHNSMNVAITAQNKVTYKKNDVVAVFNENGHNNLFFGEYYSKNISIKNIEANIYSASGQLLKKIKEKDFKDFAAYDGFSVLNDNRIKSLDYTPTVYPYFIEYTSELSSSNTAFLPKWRPISKNYTSILKSEFEISYLENLGFRKKEDNFDGFSIKKEEIPGKTKYNLENIVAYKPEPYASNFDKFTPVAKFAVANFHLEGINGKAATWDELSSWINSKLLADTEELPEETIAKIKSLTANETDTFEKVRKVYEYVQSKTRYISIQLGIGGWKPMLAKDVDRLGYGDCKALSNYTRVLLKNIGIPSYYAIVHGNDDIIDIDDQFVSLQGNHAILAIPINQEIKWLECTSQTCPADFSVNSTDNRKIFVIKPDGTSELITSKNYNQKLNTKIISGKIILDENLGFTSEVSIISGGTYYDEKSSLDNASATDYEKFYKSELRNIQEIKIEKVNQINQKKEIYFEEKLKISSPNYSKKMGNNLIFSPNFFQNDIVVPSRIRTRIKPFSIPRGNTEEEILNITLPAGYKVEFLPESTKKESKFGSYEISFKLLNNELIYTRKFILFQNNYEKSDFENFRLFLDEIARLDNAKISLVKG